MANLAAPSLTLECNRDPEPDGKLFTIKLAETSFSHAVPSLTRVM